MTESIGLFPGYSYHRIIVVSRIRKILSHISLIFRIGKIIDPTCRIRIDIDYICIKEVVHIRQGTRNGFTHDSSFVIDICRILGDHHHFIRIRRMICIQISLLRVQAVLAQCGSHVIEHFKLIIHLTGIQHSGTIYRMRGIHAFYCTQLIFIRTFPWYRLAPV